MSAIPAEQPVESGAAELDQEASRSAFGRARSRARLALVPPPARARRAPFVILLLVLLAGGLVGLLLLNTASAQDSFRLHALQSQQAALAQQQQELASRVDGIDDPARLALRAGELGLGPGGAPQFLPPGAPLPPGAIRLGNLVYVPGPILPPVSAVPSPAATASKPATKPATKPAGKKKAAIAKSPAGQRVTTPATSTTRTTPAATRSGAPAARTTAVPKTAVPPKTATTNPATGATTGGG